MFILGIFDIKILGESCHNENLLFTLRIIKTIYYFKCEIHKVFFLTLSQHISIKKCLQSI